MSESGKEMLSSHTPEAVPEKSKAIAEVRVRVDFSSAHRELKLGVDGGS